MYKRPSKVLVLVWTVDEFRSRHKTETGDGLGPWPWRRTLAGVRSEMGGTKALGKARRWVLKALLDHKNADAKDIHELKAPPRREFGYRHYKREEEKKREKWKHMKRSENPARHRGLGIPKWLLDPTHWHAPLPICRLSRSSHARRSVPVRRADHNDERTC